MMAGLRGSVCRFSVEPVAAFYKRRASRKVLTCGEGNCETVKWQASEARISVEFEITIEKHLPTF